jgi:hypothetical protein
MKMKFLAKAVVTTIAAIILTSVAHAATYTVPRITHVYADSSGNVLIKWAGSPNPGPCGTNNGWVTIQATANEALKTLAYTIYFSGKPARIDTSGCSGTREAVHSLYSPGG